MLTNLIVILLWLAALTFWIIITNDRREVKRLKEIERDIFGDDELFYK